MKPGLEYLYVRPYILDDRSTGMEWMDENAITSLRREVSSSSNSIVDIISLLIQILKKDAPNGKVIANELGVFEIDDTRLISKQLFCSYFDYLEIEVDREGRYKTEVKSMRIDLSGKMLELNDFLEIMRKLNLKSGGGLLYSCMVMQEFVGFFAQLFVECVVDKLYVKTLNIHYERRGGLKIGLKDK